MKRDYLLELRKWNITNTSTTHPSGTFDLLAVLDKRIQPSYTREMNMADQLTFNLQLSDPKCLLFDGSWGVEVWYYGTDGKLKQCFVAVTEEFSRDYGATSMGSGSGSLGTGSGDTMLVTCEGPETYLTRYITQNYKVYQRNASDVLNDVCAEMLYGHKLSQVVVDPSIDIPIDIDLSWENCWTAVGNVIAQTGGYAWVGFDQKDPALRTLYLMPVPGQDIVPKGTGMMSAVLPQ